MSRRLEKADEGENGRGEIQENGELGEGQTDRGQRVLVLLCVLLQAVHVTGDQQPHKTRQRNS